MSKQLVYIFPGQGAQFVGMGKDFYAHFSQAKEVFEQANDCLHFDLKHLIFEGVKEKLSLTKYSQLAIYVTSIAILRVIESQFPNIYPDVTAGLSLGEYSALTAAKVLPFEENLLLVQARGEYMHEASQKYPGTLAVVLGLDEHQVQEGIKGISQIWIANLNCPGQVVISGSHEAIKQASASLKVKGAKRVLPLDVSGAFHSGLMKEAQEKLKEKIMQVTLQKGKARLLMNVPGDFVEDPEEIRKYLIAQVVSPTYWEKGIRKVNHDAGLFLEIGPGKTLAGMNKKIGVSAPTISIQQVQDLELIRQHTPVGA